MIYKRSKFVFTIYWRFLKIHNVSKIIKSIFIWNNFYINWFNIRIFAWNGWYVWIDWLIWIMRNLQILVKVIYFWMKYFHLNKKLFYTISKLCFLESGCVDVFLLPGIRLITTTLLKKYENLKVKYKIFSKRSWILLRNFRGKK